jgi:DNA-binding PadR family transcriptional regulator
MKHARLREPTYFVLAALLDGPLHGYAILGRVEELSSGSVRLAAGTLYAALDRLSESELVEVVNEEVVNGRSRRYYALTPDGEATVRAEAERMAAAAKVVTDHPPRAGKRLAARGAVKPA